MISFDRFVFPFYQHPTSSCVSGALPISGDVCAPFDQRFPSLCLFRFGEVNLLSLLCSRPGPVLVLSVPYRKLAFFAIPGVFGFLGFSVLVSVCWNCAVFQVAKTTQRDSS
ncbi:hypothetical protein L873DRAFT_1047782 [Choiromyces venosus 120613-1]|uniref:Transmembrane protein n=1 Tax=Choiromyces venosus 120613-1 TaxID=1336337 RepID=A0A3N4JX24_9PEZI|nr:hypothetical protein L873DRAFT_1047782 [Choiromyces venosus 120613-1]